ncbi:MAG: helix-hairpin-helix domain-containing protein [Deltaproteobacteria bacterium]|nr:helix-hairpin-helix domain-containing protein [Deltaproteobacteria bacterium]
MKTAQYVERTQAPRPTEPHQTAAERQFEIAQAMARLKSKIEARSHRRAPTRLQKSSFEATVRPNPPSPKLRREQTKWLARVYEFQSRKQPSPTEQQLSLDIEHKLSWVLQHRRIFPLDINSASAALLLRVPGFGPKSTQRILEARAFRRLRLSDLIRMNIPLERAKFFITAEEGNPFLRSPESLKSAQIGTPSRQQLALFEA